MTSTDSRATLPEMTCAEVAELSGLYVLDALEPQERAAMRTHLETCPEAHAEIRELGALAPALASTANPIESPPELKARVMAAIAAEPRAAVEATAGASSPTRGVVMPATRRPAFADRSSPPAETFAWRPPAWMSWGAAVAAVVVLAVVGVWALGVQSRADQVARRDALVSQAIAAFSQPGSSVAVLRPSATGTTPGNGFAAVTAEGTAYLVMVGLPEAPAGQTYQAWFIRENQPTSAGLLTVDEDGYAVITNASPVAGAEVIALTVEPAGGSAQPTTDPFALGEVQQA